MADPKGNQIMRHICHFVAALSLAAIANPAHADPTDLTGWVREGSGGTWVVAPDNNSVRQTVNGDPTIFYSDFDAFGRQLSGTIRVNGTGDDDFIGFVVGFNSGELTGPGEFYLIDWKQLNQNYNGFAPAGLALSRVTMGLADNTGAWAHNPALGVTELARGATLGSTGWADLTTYTFDIAYTASNLTVSVNGIEQFNINGSFSDGRFGFYNYSQADVTYAGITDIELPPTPGVPEPAAWGMLIGGFGMAGAAMRRRQSVAVRRLI